MWTIYESPAERDSILWIGTASGGLNKLNRKTEEFFQYKYDPENQNSISSNRVYVIHESNDGIFWIGTDSGLNKFDRAREMFEYFGADAGFLNDVIKGIAEDDQGALWLSTNAGLIRYHPKLQEVKNYTVKDGLPSNEFNARAYYKSSEGEFFFGSLAGLVFFHPKNSYSKPSSFTPPVVITNFRLFQKNIDSASDILAKSITTTKQIILTHDQNTVSFEFASLDFTSPTKNKYAYRLDGLERKWNYTDAFSRVANYTNLDPGDYTLRVKGSNNDGVWNEEGTSLRITIRPPWWETWWAYTLCGLLGLGLLFGIRRSELNRQQLRHAAALEHLEAEKFQELDRLKSRFFANISHEFRTPLTLMLGPIDKWLEQMNRQEMRQDFLMSQRNGNRLLQLVNQLLDISRLESGKVKLQAQELDLVPLTRQLVMAFESLAGVRNIKLKFDAPEQEVIAYIDREKYEKIIINLVSNAIKFTQEGGVIIVDCGMGNADLKKHDKSEIPNRKSQISEFARIRVKDTGIGIPPQKLPRIFDRFYQVDDSRTRRNEGTGIGLALTKELVELHHGEIGVESEAGQGTTFTVRLPLGKEHLLPEEIADSEMRNVELETYDAELPSITEPDQLALEDTDKPNTVIHHREIPNPQSEIILVVEDNADMRAYIRSQLEGYCILEAENGAEGIKLARHQQPHIIISDVMMPEMDGFQMCESIKTDPRISHIPVILLTAKALHESKLKGLQTGADDYLTKPFDAAELTLRVKNLIRQRRLLQERFQRELKVEPKDITVTSADESFLKQAMKIVEAHMADEQFNIPVFAREIAMSRSQLNLKLRALTGYSSREFIRTLRLKRAAQLIEQGFGNVAEIAYEVGFRSLSHFSKVFEAHFGILPSKYGGNAKEEPQLHHPE